MKIIETEPLEACIQGKTVYIKPDVTNLSRRKVERLVQIAELQRYYQRNPVRFISDFFNVELLDYQRWILQMAWTCPNVLLVLTRGAGKALDKETIINTPDGRRRFGDLKVGDRVFGGDGKPCTIISVSPTFYNRCFNVTFSDGETITCNEDHLWSVYGPKNRFDLETHDTKWIAENYKKCGHSCLSVPMAKPMRYEKTDLPIPPYVLGLWLGNGTQKSSYIALHARDADEIVKYIEETGCSVYSSNEHNNLRNVCIRLPNGKPLISELKKFGLDKEKFIPEVYLHGALEDRIALFQGLMDTDGCVTKHRSDCEFSQNNVEHAQLSIDFGDLLASLGIKYANRWSRRTYTYLGEKRESSAMRFFFKADKKLPPFRLKRKYDRLMDTLPLQSTRKTIRNVQEIDPIPTNCIIVDSPDHLFLCGRKNTVTHNSFLIDLLQMAKGMLFTNYWSYIASGSGAQAQQTFQTLERLAKDNVESLLNSTGYIFKNEIVVPNANGDGFSHSVDGYKYTLYNGSTTMTLNSSVDKKRGELYPFKIVFNLFRFI